MRAGDGTVACRRFVLEGRDAAKDCREIDATHNPSLLKIVQGQFGGAATGGRTINSGEAIESPRLINRRESVAHTLPRPGGGSRTEAAILCGFLRLERTLKRNVQSARVARSAAPSAR